jgi:hypothetical protein
MEQMIESLTSEQGQRAIVTFYHILPSNEWKDQNKPNEARIETLAEQAQIQAPPDTGSFVSGLLSDQNPDFRGEIAKCVLQKFFESECRPYVEQAVQQAREPHMEPVTILVGAFLITMAAMSTKINRDETTESTTVGGTTTMRTEKHTEFQGRTPEMLEALTVFVKALPAHLLQGV